MYGDQGNELVQDAKRIQRLENLPAYQTEIVRAVTQEVRDLDRDVTNLLASFQGSFDPSSNPAISCNLLVNHLCMRRNKRCALAYHRTRTEKLEKMVWDGTDIINFAASSHAEFNPLESNSGSKNYPSPEEEEYMRQYNDLLAAYRGQWTDIDLTGSLDPPKDLFIDVRVVKDAGEIQTEYGSINLTKNSQFYVRQADVEQLIRLEYLQKLS